MWNISHSSHNQVLGSIQNNYLQTWSTQSEQAVSTASPLFSSWMSNVHYLSDTVLKPHAQSGKQIPKVASLVRIEPYAGSMVWLRMLLQGTLVMGFCGHNSVAMSSSFCQGQERLALGKCYWVLQNDSTFTTWGIVLRNRKWRLSRTGSKTYKEIHS